MRISAVTEKHAEIIKGFYLEPDGVEIIQEMTGLSYGTITSYALKRFGLKRRWKKRPLKKKDPAVESEDPNTPENIQMLKTMRCKGINGLPCAGKIRIDKTGGEGLACWLAICHYGHAFSFFIPEKIKN
jgi:hypothetical protein